MQLAQEQKENTQSHDAGAKLESGLSPAQPAFESQLFQ